MIIQIDPQSGVPIYTQLTNLIIEGIAKGHLHPGTTLPSVRSLAADLGVNMHTVNKSYHQLEKKGIIQITPKSGAMICPPNILKEFHYNRLVNDFKPMITEALVLGMEKEQIQELLLSIVEDIKGN
jgi:GntR family transcriptional regulator